MPTPMPVPIRVLVKGSSNVNWVSWMGGPRTDFAFPRVIEEKLLAKGRPCTIQTITMTSEQTSSLLGTWQREILGFSPDVIVLAHGHFETVHLFYLDGSSATPTASRLRPRRILHFVPQIHAAAGLDVAGAAASATRQNGGPEHPPSRPRKVAADMERYISQVQKVGSPLIFCLEFLPPSSRYASWFPGMPARIEVMNKTIADMVVRADKPNVRYFR